MKKTNFITIISLFVGMWTANAQIIETYAGNGTAGYSGDGGAATSAEVRAPGGLVYFSGNLYISDAGNSRIRMVNSSGNISTIAGNGTAGYSGDGSAATSAEINTPKGLVTDASGNLYIADEANNCIRKVSTSGIITTVAGNGTAGYSGDGSAATSAELHSPYGVTIDASGNLYIADEGNNRIRKVNTSGTISTYAGNGTAGFSGDGSAATSAEINHPVNVSIDPSGNLYIVDYLNSRIRKVNTSGTISTVAGNGTAGYSGDGGAATSAKIDMTTGLADMDAAGNLYLADDGNNRIRMVNTSGTISTVAGNGTASYYGDGGLATSAELHSPAIVAFDNAGNYYIADAGNSRIRVVYLSLNVSPTITSNVSCHGGSSGSASVSVSQGTTPYTYAWSGGGTTYTKTGLTAGTYTVTIHDYNDITGTTTITITQPTALSTSISVAHSTICSGLIDTLIATGSSGTSPYTYSWNPTTDLSCTTCQSVTINPTTSTTYSLTVTDHNSCSATSSVGITVHSNPTISIAASAGTICLGVTDTLIASGASSYSWNTGYVGDTLVVTPDSITPYTVTGTNSYGCSASVFDSIFVGYCAPAMQPNYILKDTIPNWNLLMTLPGAKYNLIYPRISADFHFRDSIAALYAGSDSLENRMDTAEDNPISEQGFMRWSSFWSTRVGGGSDSLNGLFSVRGDALYNTFTGNLVTAPTCSNGNWYYIGAPSSIQNGSSPNGVPAAGIIQALCFDLSDHNILYAGTTNSGLWKTINAQTSNPTWTCMTDNTFTAGTGVQSIAIGPDGAIYIATGSTRDFTSYDPYGIGVLKSTDGGTTWNTTDLSYTPGQDNVVTRKLLIDTRTTPNYTIWAATSQAVYYSTDGGTTFTEGIPYNVPPEQSLTPSNPIDIVINPTFSSNISSVIISGTGWSDNSSSFESGTTPKFPAVLPCDRMCNSKSTQDGNVINYYSCASAEVAAVFASGVDNYVSIPTPAEFKCGGIVGVPPCQIALAHDETNNITRAIFKLGPGAYTPDLYFFNLSQPNGVWEWTPFRAAGPYAYLQGMQSYYYDDFFVSPEDPSIMYATGTNILRSTDGGQHWICASDYNGDETHADIRCIAFDAFSSGGSSDKVWIGTDGGVACNNGTWALTSPYTTWENENGMGLTITQFYGLDVQSNNNLIAAGAQDNGEFTYTSSGWATDDGGAENLFEGGDAGQNAIEPSSSYPSVNLWKYINDIVAQVDVSSDFGSTWTQVKRINASYNSPLIVDGTVEPSSLSGLAYFGGDQVYDVTSKTAVHGKGPSGSTGIAAIATVPSLIGHAPYDEMYAGFPGPCWCNTPSDYLWYTSDISSVAPTWSPISSISVSWWDAVSAEPASGNPFSWWPLTDIIVKPDNDQVLWMSFGGFGGPKVITSTNGGSAWVDMSNGLPDYPVNSIVYRSGTDNELYAATDAGVYKWVPNNTAYGTPLEYGEWECFNNGLPPAMVTGIKINYCTNNLIISTYGRSVWETALAQENNITPITTNTNWTSPVELQTSIDIQPGVTLQVSSIVNIPENAQIIVEPGATLKVNSGGTLTNGCGELWAGIQINGNASQVQTSAYQGTVILNSGSTIENALNGITTNGGIITANGATFMNNQRDVQFLSYSQPNNKCSFTDCSFEVNTSYIWEVTHTYPLQPRVTMWAVHGVYFQGNTFENLIPTSGPSSISDIYQRSSGIYSIDATYKLDNCNCLNSYPPGGCCGTGNTLTGFEFGILVVNSNHANNIQVNGNTFTDNFSDIDIQTMDNATITNNTFKKTAYEGINSCIPRCATPYNIYTDECSQYNISGNTLSVTNTSPYSASDPTWGVVINNSGQSNNLVNNNSFTDIFVQSQSQGTNGNISILLSPLLNSGLQFWCNQYNQTGSINENGGADIAVNIGYGNTSGLMDEIQGWGCASGATTANNAFNYTCSSVSRANLYTYPTYINKLEYTWAGASTNDNPSCTSGPGITVGSCTGLTAVCSPAYMVNINNSNMLLVDGIDYHTTLRSQKEAFKYTKDSLTDILNRGNTPGLYTIIATGTSATIIQDSLLDPGPYLSDSVLKSAILKTTIPMETLANVLIPNSPLDSNVISTLSGIGLPDTLVARLNEYQSDSILSPRNILSNGINYYQSLMDYTDGALITAFETDTNVAHPFDSARVLLQSDSLTLPRLAQIADLQWAAGENSGALVTLDTLQHKDKDSVYYNYCRLVPVLITLSGDSNGYFALKGNSTDSTLLEGIAADTIKPGYAAARAVLQLVYNQSFVETVLPLSTGSHRPIKQHGKTLITTDASSSSILNSRFNLFPNPAKDELNIEYNLTSKVQTVTLELFDEVGHKVAMWGIPTSQTEVSENITNLPQGFYLYTIFANGTNVQQGKLIIER